MPKSIYIKKGLDIPLAGAPSNRLTSDKKSVLFAITPDDFPGYSWKAAVAVGDKVKIGSPVLYAKEDNELKLTSPVSGTVKEIARGERRKILYISIESDGKFTVEEPDTAGDTVNRLKKSGLFAMFRQRPFDIVPINDDPRDIFITGFDSAPLAPDLLTAEVKKYLENGLEVLSKLTTGKVYVSVPDSTALTSKIAEIITVKGKHPSGNVGPQISAIKPINKGECVWTADVTTVSRIGKYFAENILDFSTIVAITGPDALNPHLVETYDGVALSTLLDGEIKGKTEKIRIISGNVLTGHKTNLDGFLRFPYRQITLIDEGDSADEFMGWASMKPSKYSVKRSFPSFLSRIGKEFNFDARVKGGHRAFIISEELDKVFPFDIYPEYLIKAIMAKDIEKMEQLGIYEVAPEDFALPEFVDTSKNELQKIVREGLDYLRKETM